MSQPSAALWFRQPSVVWFRGHDLRVEDHPALLAAAQRGGPVAPLFIWAGDEGGDEARDEARDGAGGWEGGQEQGAARRWWLKQSLESLRKDLAALGVQLVFRTGDAAVELRRFVRDTGADAVFWNRCYEPELLQRDESLRGSLAADGLTAESFKAELLVEPWELSDDSVEAAVVALGGVGGAAAKTGVASVAKPFTTFHAYMKAWMALPPPPQPFSSPSRLTPLPVAVSSAPISALGLETSGELDTAMRALWVPGAAQAAQQLETFLHEVFPAFGEERCRRDFGGTSRLSPHVRFGELSPRRMYHAARVRVSRWDQTVHRSNAAAVSAAAVASAVATARADAAARTAEAAAAAARGAAAGEGQAASAGGVDASGSSSGGGAGEDDGSGSGGERVGGGIGGGNSGGSSGGGASADGVAAGEGGRGQGADSSGESGVCGDAALSRPPSPLVSPEETKAHAFARARVAEKKANLAAAEADVARAAVSAAVAQQQRDQRAAAERRLHDGLRHTQKQGEGDQWGPAGNGSGAPVKPKSSSGNPVKSSHSVSNDGGSPKELPAAANASGPGGSAAGVADVNSGGDFGGKGDAEKKEKEKPGAQPAAARRGVPDGGAAGRTRTSGAPRPRASASASSSSNISQSARAFLKNICLRDFSHHVLFHYPDFDKQPLVSEFMHFPWAKDDGSFVKWKYGNTGYPMVDAGMRELRQTGWVHNGMRFLLASFLTKYLLLPWTRGLAEFYQLLLDGDVSANALGWQWTAGSNTDAFPFSCLVNPVKFGLRQDPSGAYIRRWLPELSSVPIAYLHQPWKAPPSVLNAAGVKLGEHYPIRVVEASLARSRARDAMLCMRKIFASLRPSRELASFPVEELLRDWPEEVPDPDGAVVLSETGACATPATGNAGNGGSTWAGNGGSGDGEGGGCGSGGGNQPSGTGSGTAPSDRPSSTDASKAALLPSLWSLLHFDEPPSALPHPSPGLDQLIAVDTACLADGALVLATDNMNENPSMENALMRAHAQGAAEAAAAVAAATAVVVADVGHGGIHRIDAGGIGKVEDDMVADVTGGISGSGDGDVVGTGTEGKPTAVMSGLEAADGADYEELNQVQGQGQGSVQDGVAQAPYGQQPQPFGSQNQQLGQHQQSQQLSGQEQDSQHQAGQQQAAQKQEQQTRAQQQPLGVGSVAGIPGYLAQVQASQQAQLPHALGIAPGGPTPVGAQQQQLNQEQLEHTLPGGLPGQPSVPSAAEAGGVVGSAGGGLGVDMGGQNGGIAGFGQLGAFGQATLPSGAASVLDPAVAGAQGSLDTAQAAALYAQQMGFGGFYGAVPGGMPLVGTQNVPGGYEVGNVAQHQLNMQAMMTYGFGGMYSASNGMVMDPGIFGANGGQPGSNTGYMQVPYPTMGVGGAQQFSPSGQPLYFQPPAMQQQQPSGTQPLGQAMQAQHGQAAAMDAGADGVNAGHPGQQSEARRNPGAGADMAGTGMPAAGVLGAVSIPGAETGANRVRGDAGPDAPPASAIAAAAAAAAAAAVQQQAQYQPAHFSADGSKDLAPESREPGSVNPTIPRASSGLVGVGTRGGRVAKAGSGRNRAEGGRSKRGGGDGEGGRGRSRGGSKAGRGGGAGRGKGGAGDGSGAGAAGDREGVTVEPIALKQRQNILLEVLQDDCHEFYAFAKYLKDAYVLTEHTDRHSSKDYIRLCTLKDDFHKGCTSDKEKLKIYKVKTFFSKVLKLEVTGEWDRHGHGGIRGPWVYGIRRVSNS